ncbi:MAG: tRNA pseudouridine(55) synthase TruB [Atopobiaceae bacterium]|nr:tRNA pseudouridine(55) synthase TruB [Atopobiaceae bacterium]
MRRGSSGINCLIGINKPCGLTSHDVVGRVRRMLGERRVGHAGTLDPAASGVMLVGVGQATRLLGLLTLDDKRYVADISFGTETTTDDSEGEVTREAKVPARLAEPAVAEVVVASLKGPCLQVPPAYSAISVNGKRSYARARAGEEVELAPRQVMIHEAQLLGVEQGEPLVWKCELHVSKGTYIRSIARDLGRSLQTAAHLSGLCRTASGPVDLDRCLTLEELEERGAQRIMEAALDPVFVLGCATHELNDYELDAVRVGKQFSCKNVRDSNGLTRLPAVGERVCLTREGSLMGVWRQGEARLACETNFPQGIGGVAL